MKLRLLLTCLLLLTSQALSAATWPTRTHSRKHYARKQRQAEHRRDVPAPKVRHAYNRNRGLRSLITF